MLEPGNIERIPEGYTPGNASVQTRRKTPEDGAQDRTLKTMRGPATNGARQFQDS